MRFALRPSDLTYCNLGDVDRFGHADLTGPTSLLVQRRAALAGTAAQIGRFLDFLEQSGRWPTSVVLVLADHSMDWSTAGAFISLDARFGDDPLLAGRYAIAQNGGADLLYWRGSAPERSAAVVRMRELALDTPGVLSVHAPGDLGLSDRAGDVVAYCRAGWRFTDPSERSNPIPGNHGHPATASIPFFVGGGSAYVRRGVRAGTGARTIDVAPTVAWLLGLAPPPGGWHGTARTAAFTGQPAPV